MTAVPLVCAKFRSSRITTSAVSLQGIINTKTYVKQKIILTRTRPNAHAHTHAHNLYKIVLKENTLSLTYQGQKWARQAEALEGQ